MKQLRNNKLTQAIYQKKKLARKDLSTIFLQYVMENISVGIKIMVFFQWGYLKD